MVTDWLLLFRYPELCTMFIGRQQIALMIPLGSHGRGRAPLFQTINTVKKSVMGFKQTDRDSSAKTL